MSDPKYPLRLVEADLTKPETWKKAVHRCTYVFHVASPFPAAGATDEAVIVRTAVEGTTSVLQACADAGTVKRVVVTSSIAAVSSGTTGSPGNPPDYVYTEKDWSVESACGPYVKSKLKAEQAAWEFVKKLEEDKRFELTVVNPAYVQGPLLSASSGEGTKDLCQRLLNGKLPAIPDVSSPIVDVRDVAAAHIAAMEKSEAAGNRYILSNRTLHFREIAQIVGDEFQPQGYKIPTKNLPKVVLWVGKFFDSGLKEIYPLLGKSATLSNERMVKELGVTPRPVEESIVETCYSLIELGLARKTRGYLGHPSKRPPPAPIETANEKGEAAKEDGQAEAKTQEAKPEEEKSDETPAKGEDTEAEKPTEPQADSTEGRKDGDEKPEETETAVASQEAEEKTEEKPASEDEQKSEEPATSEEKPADEGEKAADEAVEPADEGEKPAGEGEKPADEGEKEPADEGEKPADVVENEPTDVAEKEPADEGDKEPAGEGEKEPADEGDKEPTDEGEKPADEGAPAEGDAGNEEQSKSEE